MFIDPNRLTTIRAQMQLTPEMQNMMAMSVGNDYKNHIKHELVLQLVEELFNNDYIVFSETDCKITNSKQFRAEIKVLLDTDKMWGLKEFVSYAMSLKENELHQLNNIRIRSEGILNYKDKNGVDLYIGNIVKIKDNGYYIHELIMPAKNPGDLPYLGGFVYDQHGKMIKFDVNYCYCDTLLPPEMEKVQTINENL